MSYDLKIQLVFENSLFSGNEKPRKKESKKLSSATTTMMDWRR
jgi:hypothetical protein